MGPFLCSNCKTILAIDSNGEVSGVNREAAYYTEREVSAVGAGLT